MSANIGLLHFNPRARVGRDCTNRWCLEVFRYFNPRARVGRDLGRPAWAMHQGISIHAPAWGATPRSCCWNIHSEFQSTRPRGARQSLMTLPTYEFLFQSTRPRGARRPRRKRRQRGAYFNPRARVGRDSGDIVNVPPSVISIHAPAWGATSCRVER